MYNSCTWYGTHFYMSYMHSQDLVLIPNCVVHARCYVIHVAKCHTKCCQMSHSMYPGFCTLCFWRASCTTREDSPKITLFVVHARCHATFQVQFLHTLQDTCMLPHSLSRACCTKEDYVVMSHACVSSACCQTLCMHVGLGQN